MNINISKAIDCFFKFKLFFCFLLIFICILGVKYLQTALTLNNEISIWFSKDDPDLNNYYHFTELFGNDRTILILLHDQQGLLNTNTLNKINTLTDELITIDGVSEVLSITNFKDFLRKKEKGASSITFDSHFHKGFPIDEKDLDYYTKSILSSQYLLDRVINHDGKSSVLLIKLDPLNEIESKRSIIIDEIKGISNTILTNHQFSLGGLDILTYELNKLSSHDFTLFMGINYVFMILIILFFFPKLIYVLIAFLTTITSIIITLSLYGYFGYRLNIFTIIIPSLIIILGIIIVLHIVNEFEFLLQEKQDNSDVADISKQAIVGIFKPCLFTAITTAIGFLSLLSSSTSVLKEFGVFAAIGVLIVFISAFIFSSCLLKFINQSGVRLYPSKMIATNLVKLSNHIFRHSLIYWSVTILLLLISIIGITRIKIDMDPLGYFPADSQFVIDHEFISKNWGDYFPVDLILVTKNANTIKNPDLINGIIDFQNDALNLDNVTKALSFVNVLERFTEITFRQATQEILSDPGIKLQMLGKTIDRIGKESRDYFSKDQNIARITLIGPNISTKQVEMGMSDISDLGKKHFGEMAELKIVGYPALFVKMMNNAFDSMKKSLLLATVLIFFTMLILFKDFKLALVSMIPNLFPIIIFLGVLGFSQIHLDLAVSTVAAIVLGIAIDDTIHFLNRYNKEKSSEIKDKQKIISNTHYHVGRIILISSIILFFGFCILLFASIKTLFFFGLLVAISVIAASIGDLILLPLALKKFDL